MHQALGKDKAGPEHLREAAEPGDDNAEGPGLWRVREEGRGGPGFHVGNQGRPEGGTGAFHSFIQRAFIVLSSVPGPGDPAANTKGPGLCSHGAAPLPGGRGPYTRPPTRTPGAEGHSRKGVGSVAPGEKAAEWGTGGDLSGRMQCLGGPGGGRVGVEGPIKAQA